MKVAIFEAAISQGGRPAFSAFLQGVRASGDECHYTRDMGAKCDIAVHASGVKSGRLARGNLSASRKRLMDRFPRSRVVIESPAFREGLQFDGAVPHYWRVGLNGFLRDEADYANENSPPDRWERISAEQGIEVQDWNPNTGSSHLIMLQKATDASLRGTDIHNWCRAEIAKIRETTPDAHIVVRPHPLERDATPEFEGAVTSHDLTDQGLRMDLIRAKAVITFTSLSAIEAICAGVPTWATDPGSPAYPVARGTAATRAEVDQWLCDLAYTQWTLEELQEGTPWRRLRARWGERYKA